MGSFLLWARPDHLFGRTCFRIPFSIFYLLPSSRASSLPTSHNFLSIITVLLAPEDLQVSFPFFQIIGHTIEVFRMAAAAWRPC